jgi:hypothetical protein
VFELFVEALEEYENELTEAELQTNYEFQDEHGEEDFAFVYATIECDGRLLRFRGRA